MWIKICGNTTFEDAQLAVSAGADALGFVFAASPRQVTVVQAGAITSRLPANIERYGVFVDAGFDEIVSTVDQAGLTGVQLHADPQAAADPSLATRLRRHYSAASLANGRRRRLGLLQVLHFDARTLDAQLTSLGEDRAVDAALIDSRTATAPGGTGLRFDWAAASGSFFTAAPHLRLIAAGGLAPENVAEAIATLRPWGIDVVTGVEASPGRKDPAKLRAFIDRARSAAAALAQPAPTRS